ncbi:MAG: HD domain-containing phosphohydrolase [Pseudomonadota bacterium]|nr:HD domain-containing phosphohydrolase [Pseudomonadota bacterium]
MKPTTAAAVDFSCANPHALATILDASQTQSIIAARDIFDITGTKLWARDLPVSQALQRKLLDRQLREPLESCLKAENGVTAHTLVEALEALLAKPTPLTALLRAHADTLVREAAKLPVHPVAQLLLTAARASRPAAYDHAIQAMALNGALMLAQAGGQPELRTAMLCGLLHDLGEMYIGPEFGEADAERTLDVLSYQQLVVHPHVGHLLIKQLTDYPAEVARAIAEHHERMDGSGYPHCLRDGQLSTQGRLLAVTESTLATLAEASAPLSRASVALRVVPGEYDLRWVGLITQVVRQQPAAAAQCTSEELQQRLTKLGQVMHDAGSAAAALRNQAMSPALKDALTLTEHLLARLHGGLMTSGLWNADPVATTDAAEVEAVDGELRFRLRRIERAVRLSAGLLTDEDAQRLDGLCRQLTISG